MKLEITLDLDNAAFETFPMHEALLTITAALAKSGSFDASGYQLARDLPGALIRNSNGNTCGSWTVSN